MRINIINSNLKEVNINPKYITRAYINEHGQAVVTIVGFESIWSEYTNEGYQLPPEYTIDMESYKRIVAYIDAVEKQQCKLVDENDKLRELVLGLKWCSENYGCKNLCPLYDKPGPDSCREARLLRELGIEVTNG